MLINGKAPRPGQVMKLPNLAKTFRSLAEHGKAGYYKGRIAEAIVELIQSKGGVMDLEDLASHDTDFVEPIQYTFNEEVTVYECPPNGQGDPPFTNTQWNKLTSRNSGITALLALGILDNIGEQGKIKSLLEMEHNSAEYLHVLVESLRYALRDYNKYLLNVPLGSRLPVNVLLSFSVGSCLTLFHRQPVLCNRSGCTPHSPGGAFEQGTFVNLVDSLSTISISSLGVSCVPCEAFRPHES